MKELHELLFVIGFNTIINHDNIFMIIYKDKQYEIYINEIYNNQYSISYYIDSVNIEFYMLYDDTGYEYIDRFIELIKSDFKEILRKHKIDKLLCQI